ncbi:MAG: hypothetical protein K6T91_01055 [Firmicutes bacterium]|nr:hypothetical protein [Bacillota bacterium]
MKLNHITREDGLVGPVGITGELCDALSIDETILRYLRRMAIRKGVNCQTLFRKWAKDHLEIEMRKLPF